MSRTLDIADAVVTELAGAPPGTFALPFTPQRRVLPQFELSELKDLKVTVVPRSVENSPAARGLTLKDVQIDIGIQKRLGKDVDSEIVPLLTLVEQIDGWLRQRPLQAAGNAPWLKSANDPLYASEHLAEDRVFTSVLTVSYRVMV
ncbi:MAG TPA: hypothetical protein VM098_07145 [Phycisphaerae bacterium]|nr:hypothetical protein [Phycisphaerae bacterium]